MAQNQHTIQAARIYCEIKDPLLNWIYSPYLASIWTLASSYFCVLCKMCSCCTGWERGFVQKAPTITPHITTGSASFWQEMAQYLVIWTHRRPWQRKDLQMKTCLSSHNFFLKTDWNQKCFIRLQSLHFREGSSPAWLAQFPYNSVFNGSFNVWEAKM